MPRPRTSTIHMRTAPARTNEHARPFICTWPWPQTSPNSRRTGLLSELAPRTHRLEETGHAGRTNTLWVERTSTTQFPHGNRPPPHPRGTTPFTNPDGVGDRCTNAGKPTNHPFTACPPTTCHKCGQPGHIQRHCPTRTLRQTQRQYRDVRKVPVNTNHLRVHRQKTRLLV